MWPPSPELGQVFIQHFGNYFSKIAMRVLAKNLALVACHSDDFNTLVDEFSDLAGKETGYCPFLGKVFHSKSRRRIASPKPIGDDWKKHLLAERAIYALAFGQNTEPVRHGSQVNFYKTWHIDKGPGRKRRIDSPRECLRSIQSVILADLLDPVQSSLPAHVICRPGSRAIVGAAAHAGGRFLLGLDIRDFYPSMRLSHVVEGLKAVPRPAKWAKFLASTVRNRTHFSKLPLPIGCLTAKLAEQITAHVPCHCFRGSFCSRSSALPCWFKAWLDLPENRCLSHWEAVLIGRLITWRGRLPQGAPTSPAMANLAFGKIDQRIMAGLGARFAYTRYMDDIAISITAREAKVQMIDGIAAMRRFGLGVVNGALRDSGFRLNHAKTVATEAGPRGSGRVHTVTGYRVGDGVVELPREVRRFFRGLGAKIRKADCRLEIISKPKAPGHGGQKPVNDWPLPQWNVEKSRHEYRESGATAEANATAVILQLHPGLRWIAKPAEFSGVSLPQEGMAGNGTTLRLEMEILLSQLWTGNWTALRSGPNSIVIQDSLNRSIGSLASDSLPSFFLLDKETAWNCTAFHSWFAGHVGRLSVPADLRSQGIAAGISRLWDEFRPILGNLKIGELGIPQAQASL